MHRRLVRLCLVGAGAFDPIGGGGDVLVAGGQDGVKRGFSILDFGFFPAVAGHANAWILDYPCGAACRSVGRQKAAVWGGVLNPISKTA